MPHVSEVRASDHDRHDLLLVAALAAGDLAGTDRDQAIAQTESCDDCRTLRDDLVAIARATATVPPPIATTGRDFRLTPDQARDLRRTGWRRLVPTGWRGSMTRPLGAALATFGIAGILIGTLSLNISLGSSAAAPQAAAGSGGAAERTTVDSAAGAAASGEPALAPVPAASAAAASAAAAPAPSAAASMAPAAPTTVPASDTGSGRGNFGSDSGGQPGSSSPTSVGIAAAPSVETITKEPPTGAESTTSSATSGSWSPLLIVSAIALVIGFALLVLARRRENDPS
jgi:hypothetical protein